MSNKILFSLTDTYPTDLVSYVWNKHNPVGAMDKTLSQFDVTSCSKKSYTRKYVAGEYSILEAVFVFERRLGYYLIQVYIPCIFLVVLAGLSFWVDVKATPARVALSLTTLLTIATIWSAANSNMPPVSYVKAIDIYFLTSFGFVLFTLLEYIAVLNYHILKDAITRKLSFCEKDKKNKKHETYCLKHGIVLKRRNMSSSKSSDENLELEQLECPIGMLQRNHNNHNNESKHYKENGKKIVSNIDKMTKFFYPVAYIVFNVVYWYRLRRD